LTYLLNSLFVQVLIIGGGPCGLRTAIEVMLLGGRAVVVEKRDRLSRNNVLHLWPFLIHDLKMLGAKKFFGKFCAGAIDHISECGGKFALLLLQELCFTSADAL
jgi:2-polyprenyl-6-methoxyphenol hydroxylase-like FAD-dependent oxidoreductase